VVSGQQLSALPGLIGEHARRTRKLSPTARLRAFQALPEEVQATAIRDLRIRIEARVRDERSQVVADG